MTRCTQILRRITVVTLGGAVFGLAIVGAVGPDADRDATPTGPVPQATISWIAAQAPTENGRP